MADNSRLEADVCYNHGNFLASQGKLQEALSAYELAISLDSQVPMYYNNRAAILKRLGKLEEAVEQYRRIISDFSDYGKVHLSIASTEIELSNHIASECSYKDFIAAYVAGNFEFSSRWGGIDRSQGLYGEDELKIIFLSSINYLKKSLRIQAIKSFNQSLNLAKVYSLIPSNYSSIQIDSSLEAIAINNAVIVADYENNPEVNYLEVKLLKEKWTGGSVIEGCSCNNWYLEINKNRGNAASYSLDMVIYTDSNHDYPFVIVTCGLKTSFIITPQMENLTIYSIWNKSNLQYTSFWSIPSIFMQDNYDITRQFIEKFIVPASKTEPIIQITETFSKILLESLMN